MPVAIRDAYRTIVVTTGTGSGGLGGVSTANSPASTFQLDGGFGISLVYDNVNNKVTIVNTGNGTGALTTITEQESLGTYYPIFSRAPSAGDINGVTGTYQLDTMYIEQTAQPLTYNPGTGELSSVGLTLTGALTLGSVTSTGVTGTGNLVFSASPTFTTPTLGAASATSVNGLTITSSTGTFTLTNAKTFAVQNSITIAGTDSTTITLPASTGTVALNNQTFFIGTTSITINRATAAQSLTGITSIDGYSAGIAGGAIGHIPYQSAANTTLFVTGNITTTPQFVTSTGTGTVAQAPTLTSSTGTGSVVLATSPTLTTPTLGAATATSINKMAITAPASSSTLAVADGKTFTVNNTITLAGTDSTTITLPSTTGTVPLNNQTFYIGTTGVAINRASANLALTGITSIDGSAASATKATNLAGGNATTLLGAIGYQSAADTTTLLSPNVTATKKFLRMTGDGTNGTAPVWDTLVAGDIPAHYIGTTSITFNRASASQSLTGITSIDGYAAGIAGGTIGQIPYQSAANTTVFLSGNTATTPNFVTSTGTGSAAQAPTLTSSTGTGNVVLATNPTITAPTSGNANSTTDADATVDASTTELYAYVQSASATARTINISNLTAGRKVTLYLRNTNAATKTINFAASTTASGFSSLLLSKGDAGGTAASAVTLAAASGTATVTVFNANGTIGGSIG